MPQNKYELIQISMTVNYDKTFGKSTSKESCLVYRHICYY